MGKQTRKIIEAYKFAVTQTKRLWRTDPRSAEFMKTLASLAYIHLTREGVDAEEIMNKELNLEDDE